ncbi:MAG TPA: BioY family transporter, partial [Clostridiaceae bacterium]|nr:BioY family transporter [Clostridiaceae bacterium]
MKINTKEMVLTALFTALTVAGAKLNLMLPNIPVTLQTAIVMLAG